ncbi:MAG: hypothetical protein IJI05_02120 [Erysipelotrichaceae bacterium]|nr:hypothetical protein [Erysipelotrichaceae bacterium]
MKKTLKLTIIFLTALLFVMPAAADIGPKPSLTIRVKGLEDVGEYYITVLSKTDNFGPYSASDTWNDKPEYQAFADYRDPDGYYFLGLVSVLGKDNSFSIGYWPPEDFKVVVYVPSQERYYASEPAKRSAFNTIMLFTVIDGTCTIEDVSSIMDYLPQGIVCVVGTVIIEALLALLFGYKEKLKVIIITNIITNLFLQAAVVFVNFTSGILTMLIFYVLFEIAVLLVEFLVYCFLIKGNKFKLFFYTLLANVLTFLGGFYIHALWS